MQLSCCLWGLNEGSGLKRYWRRFRNKRVQETESLPRLSRLGFTQVDICPSMLRSMQNKAMLKTLGMEVVCVSISHEAPQGGTLDSEDASVVAPLMTHLEQSLKHAAEVGAHYAYVVPGPLENDKTLSNLGIHIPELAELAQELGIKFLIEHFPGTALPTVKGTLEFIRTLNHPNLYLLFDIGHAQISQEDPAEVLPSAGDRLAYIHLDDNDGEQDLHLALTEGIQTEDSLRDFFRVVKEVGYEGPVSLEMRPTLPNPLDAIGRSKEIVERIVNFD